MRISDVATSICELDEETALKKIITLRGLRRVKYIPPKKKSTKGKSRKTTRRKTKLSVDDLDKLIQELGGNL